MLPELQDGQVLVRNLYISVDPYMRGRMNDVKSYSAPFALDAALDGGAVGEVIASRSADAQGGRRRRALSWAGANTRSWTPRRPPRRAPDLAPASAFLGALGMTGLTAYAGLLKVAEFKPGDAVFVSGAAGAVGSLVGQIAKAMGASRVIGSAGRPEKVARLLRTRLRRRLQLPRRPGAGPAAGGGGRQRASTSTSTTSAASTLRRPFGA